jgi:hypothetical protein
VAVGVSPPLAGRPRRVRPKRARSGQADEENPLHKGGFPLSTGAGATGLEPATPGFGDDPRAAHTVALNLFKRSEVRSDQVRSAQSGNDSGKTDAQNIAPSAGRSYASSYLRT